MPVHRVYLVPGMFGFGQLAGYDYFVHLRAALRQRFSDAGTELRIETVPTPPTSSLRFRSRVLAKTITASARRDDEPIHLVGHSTGGLDGRLALSPTTNLGLDPELMQWTRRVTTCTSINTPHYGTPLAGYFATVSGTRVLYALSLLTVVSLSIGAPSFAVFSKLLSGLGGIDQLLGGNLALVSRMSDMLLRVVDERGREEITDFLGKVRVDQGAIIQIMPEAMDLFDAAAENNEGVHYGSIATAAPAPQAIRFARRVRSPYAALTAAMFSTLYQFTSQRPRPYTYAEPDAEQTALLGRHIPGEVTDHTNDGIVPTLSMIWGDLVWCGEGDHLDVIGHFQDDEKPAQHVDWMTSGAHFDRGRFASAMDALAGYLLKS